MNAKHELLGLGCMQPSDICVKHIDTNIWVEGHIAGSQQDHFYLRGKRKIVKCRVASSIVPKLDAGEFVRVFGHFKVIKWGSAFVKLLDVIKILRRENMDQ